ncbi:MAG: hypothetical protein C0524_04315 [Rhodobacter sp.]|nr:hypothetical protein [Rhodobacter sp.]
MKCGRAIRIPLILLLLTLPATAMEQSLVGAVVDLEYQKPDSGSPSELAGLQGMFELRHFRTPGRSGHLLGDRQF